MDTERLSEKELQEFKLKLDGTERYAILTPAWVDLAIATEYTGLRNERYTQEDILNLTPDQVKAFDQVLKFNAGSSTLNQNRKRILRILSYLGLIEYDHDILLQTTILDDLCSNLSPFDLNKFRIAIYQTELPCRIEFPDRDNLVTFVDRVNSETVRLSNRIKRGGSKAALITAVNLGELDNARTLLDRGVSPNFVIKEKNPLISAAGGGNVEIVDLLLARGADPTLVVKQHKTALTEISRNNPDVVIPEINRETIVRALIRAQPDLEKQNGPEALYNATFSLNLVRILLDAGVSPVGDLELSPLVHAAEQGQLEVVKLLLERGAPVNEVDAFKGTALFVAVDRGYHEIVELLIEKGADVDFSGEVIGTPLTIASGNNDLQTVRMLIEAGADPDLTGFDGRTALDIARENGFEEIVEILEPITYIPADNESYYPSEDDYE